MLWIFSFQRWSVSFDPIDHKLSLAAGFHRPRHLEPSGLHSEGTVLGRSGSKLVKDHAERQRELRPQRNIRPIELHAIERIEGKRCERLLNRRLERDLAPLIA